jgi:chloramphenicol 3-O-phosphotransferase
MRDLSPQSFEFGRAHVRPEVNGFFVEIIEKNICTWGKFPRERCLTKLPRLSESECAGRSAFRRIELPTQSHNSLVQKAIWSWQNQQKKFPQRRLLKKIRSMLDNALGQIEKMFGKGSIMKLDANENAGGFPGISTGALSLDLALGGRGFPRGRIIELFGPESSGKTTLALACDRVGSKAGGIAAFVDAEHALDPQWARKLGVNLDELLVSQPSYGEEALQITEMLIKSNSVDIIVIDSVAALVPKAELDGEIGDTHVGLQARMMSQAMRKADGCHFESQGDGDLHQPDSRKDRRDVRQSGNNPGWSCPEVLQFMPC